MLKSFTYRASLMYSIKAEYNLDLNGFKDQELSRDPLLRADNISVFPLGL